MSSSYVFQVVPADLNALLYMSETTIAWSARRIGNEALATTYEDAAAARRAAMEELLWDEAAGDLKVSHFLNAKDALIAFKNSTLCQQRRGLLAPSAGVQCGVIHYLFVLLIAHSLPSTWECAHTQ